jgi:hypothetical protein
MNTLGNTAHNAVDRVDARMSSWLPYPGSADADLLNDLPIITPRARDLV